MVQEQARLDGMLGYPPLDEDQDMLSDVGSTALPAEHQSVLNSKEGQELLRWLREGEESSRGTPSLHLDLIPSEPPSRQAPSLTEEERDHSLSEMNRELQNGKGESPAGPQKYRSAEEGNGDDKTKQGTPLTSLKVNQARSAMIGRDDLASTRARGSMRMSQKLGTSVRNLQDVSATFASGKSLEDRSDSSESQRSGVWEMEPDWNEPPKAVIVVETGFSWQMTVRGRLYKPAEERTKRTLLKGLTNVLTRGIRVRIVSIFEGDREARGSVTQIRKPKSGAMQIFLLGQTTPVLLLANMRIELYDMPYVIEREEKEAARALQQRQTEEAAALAEKDPYPVFDDDRIVALFHGKPAGAWIVHAKYEPDMDEHVGFRSLPALAPAPPSCVCTRPGLSPSARD